MPIAKLFVEGKLESVVLNPVLQGNPVLQVGGSKNSLRPRAFTERRENKVAAGYLRDRDFDFDPPYDVSRPTVDSEESGVPFGWRWCRHEIENYLIEPTVVVEASGWTIAEVEDGLRQAAKRIGNYQAARWTIGMVRRQLPPHYELRTRPAELSELELPPDLDSVVVNAWALTNIENHRAPIVAVTEPAAVQTALDDFSGRFDDAFLADVANILLWFSGKDMLAGLADWLSTKGVPNPGAFRALLRNWVRDNPTRMRELITEWKEMVAVLQA